jgi:hypothetical protein
MYIIITEDGEFYAEEKIVVTKELLTDIDFGVITVLRGDGNYLSADGEFKEMDKIPRHNDYSELRKSLGL